MSLEKPYLPQEVNGLDIAFGVNVRDLMPDQDDIPKEFKDFNSVFKKGAKGPERWVQFQNQWFFKGVDSEKIRAKKGIDKTMALRHLQTIQGSWEPKHEHKSSAVAYLASLWFDDWSE